MSELPAAPVRLWSAVLVAGAVVLFVAGGAIDNFRPEPSGLMPEDTPRPVPGDPQGELESPPSRFEWTPGGDDVDVAQVVIFRESLDLLWQSSPRKGPPVELVPEDVFADVPAGEWIYWRIREVQGGRPRATSALVQFRFATDVHGRGVPAIVPGPLVPAD